METNFSKSHEEMQLERINTVAEPKGWWHKEVEELKQQLAAALAVIKVKDEALKLIALDDCCTSPAPIAQEALAIQPDDSALKAWLGEPVGIIEFGGFWLNENNEVKVQDGTPLYAPKGVSK